MAIEHFWLGCTAVVAAIIAAKWALELGMGPGRQLLWAIAGFVVPPVALLALFVRLARQARLGGDAGRSW